MLSGLETHLGPDPKWFPVPIFVCLNYEYSLKISICHQSLLKFFSAPLFLFLFLLLQLKVCYNFYFSLNTSV